MPSILDLLRTAATGQPDPTTQVMQGLQGAQGGGPPPAPAPGGPGAGPGGPGGPAPAPPQVQAYQSAPDMQQLYLKFAQQQQADEGFNRGLGLLAASTYPGRHPEMIMNAMTGNTADPGALFGNIMKIQGWQQQQKQYEAFVNSAPDIAKQIDPSGSFTPNEVLAMGPDSVRTALSLRIPPDALRTRNAFKQQFITENADKPDPANPGQKLGSAGAATLFEQQNPMSLTMAGATGAGAAAAPLLQRTLRQNDWQTRHQGQPLPDYFSSDEALAAHDAQVAGLTAAQTRAADGLSALQGGLGYMKGNVTSIAQNPNLTPLLTKLKQNPLLVGAARKANWLVQQAPQGYGLNQDETDLLHKIDALTVSDTGSLKSAAPHLGGQIGAIDSQLGTLQDFNSGPDNWKDNLSKLNDAIDTTSANGHAAAGQLQTVVDKNSSNYEMKVDPSYLPGGRNFLGEPKQMSASDVATARQAMVDWEKKYPGQGRARYIRHLQVQGFAPASGL